MEQHMKKMIISSLVLAGVATPALAHPGDHSYDLAKSLFHLLTQPDHLAMLAVAIAAIAFAVFKFRGRKV
jgi:hydrogenase/urease accessory protein HupE